MAMTHTQRLVRFALFVMLAAAPVPAYADWFVTPFVGVKFGGSTSIFDLDQAASQTTFTFGGSVSRVGAGIFGVEVEGAYVPGYFERESAALPLVVSSYVVDLSGNAIFALPPNLTGGGLRPYFTTGLGLMHAEGVDLFSFLRIRRTLPAITLGAGATGLVTNRVGVRFDLRYLRSLARDDEFQIQVGHQLSYWRGTIGVAIKY
jgi:hypothetical protein